MKFNLDFTDPNCIYMLGLLWADGWITNIGYNNRVSIEILEDDFNDLKHVFDKCSSRWLHYKRNRPNRTRTIVHSTVVCREITDFLIKNDYKIKSSSSASKILSNIPDNLKYFWFRGFSDGDGCFYINQKLNLYQYSVSNHHEHNWNYFRNFLADNNISKYSIKLHHNIKRDQSHSLLRMTGYKTLNVWIDLIYPTWDNIGLQRKYDKSLIIRNRQVRKTITTV